MSENESYLNDHLAAEERAEREQIELEVEAAQMLAYAIRDDKNYNELLGGYQLAFSNTELLTMLRNLQSADAGNFRARVAIVDCITAFERRCLDCIEHQIKESR